MWKKQCDLVLTGAKEASSDWNDSFLRAIDTASGKSQNCVGLLPTSSRLFSRVYIFLCHMGVEYASLKTENYKHIMHSTTILHDSYPFSSGVGCCVCVSF